MNKNIYKLEVRSTTFPIKIDWMGDFDEDLVDWEKVTSKTEVLLFPSYNKVSSKIKELTNDYYQFWADVNQDEDGNDEEHLFYKNGHEDWDKEITIIIYKHK